MSTTVRSTTAVAFALFLGACGAGEPQTDAVLENTQPGGYIVTTNSDAARQYIADGQLDFDYGRNIEASANFKQAIAEDSTFAFAYLLAWSAAQSASEAEVMGARAVELAPNASEYERLIIQAVDRNDKRDNAGAQQLMKTLTDKYPDNSRAWELRAWSHLTVSDVAEGRAHLEKAIAAAPAAVAPRMYLAESYTLAQPTDHARAETLLLEAIELDAKESFPHDLLGDVYRAQGKLQQAAASYTRAAELDPTAGGPLQQRAHVNSMLGRYPEARADYDAAIALAKGNSKVGLALYRPFVNLFEGAPDRAIAELEQLYASIDGMDIPEPDGQRMFVLDQISQIAAHHRMHDVIRSAAARRKQTSERMIARVNTDDFRRDELIGSLLAAGRDAAYLGNFAEATRLADEYEKARASEQSINKNWPLHNLRGTIALLQGRNQEAIDHFAQSNPNNIYITYQTALAHERLGHAAEAKAGYQRVAAHNFNAVGLALTRREAEAKAR